MSFIIVLAALGAVLLTAPDAVAPVTECLCGGASRKKLAHKSAQI